MFIERLFHVSDSSSKSCGIVNDLCRVLLKYGLGEYLEIFVSQIVFHDKKTWRNIVAEAVEAHETLKVTTLLTFDPELRRFSRVYGEILRVHPAWVAENKTRGHRKHFRDLAKLNCVPTAKRIPVDCVYCNTRIDDQLDHYFHHCKKYVATREHYWGLVINSFSVVLSTFLYNLPDMEMTAVILGRKLNVDILDEDALLLLDIGAKIWQVLAHEKCLLWY